MTREFRLMLAEQGAADPELMGAGMTAPKSAAEVMREMAADVVMKARMGERDTDLRSIIHAIRAIPLPADPRDAEIERLRANLEKCAGQFEFLARMASSPRPRATDKSDTRTKWVIIKDECEAGSDFARAALAQSGEVG